MRRSPTDFGGKSIVAPEVWARLGCPDVYVEPFAGSAAMLLARPDSHAWWDRIETINDADGLISNVWRAIQRDPDAVAAAADQPVNECVPAGTLIATPYGNVPVEAIRPGMMVLGESRGRIIQTQVLAVKQSEVDADEIMDVGPLTLTRNHPVWTAESGYLAADKLQPGSTIGVLYTYDTDTPTIELRDLRNLVSPATSRRKVLFHTLRRNRPTHPDEALRSLRCVIPCPSRQQGANLLLPILRQAPRLEHRSGNDARQPGCRKSGERATGSQSEDACVGSVTCQSHLFTRNTRESACGKRGAGLSRPQLSWPRTDQDSAPDRQSPGMAYRIGRVHVRTSWQSQNPSRKIQEALLVSPRHRELGIVDRGGNRWTEPCRTAGARCQTNRVAGKPRLDCSAVHEPRSTQRPGRSGGADPGRCTVYNFQTYTGNYFAAGILVHNCDLHARHIWLVNNRESLTERLCGDPDWCDPRAAGWWIWGVCSWIGSGWCAGNGPWNTDGERIVNTGDGVNRQRPHLGDAGRGVNRKIRSVAETHCEDWAAHIRQMMQRLSNRLRRVRICSGDWLRVCGSDTTTTKRGACAIFCLHPDTLVRTSDERFIRMQDVIPGETLHGGRTVNKVMARPHCGALISCRAQGLPDPLVMTPEHRVVRIGKRPGNRQETRKHAELWASREVVRADELRIGDYLLVPLGGDERNFQWEWSTELRPKGNRTKPIRFSPSTELYRLLGYFASEGSIVRSGKLNHPSGIQFVFCDDERDTHVKDCMDLCRRTFGVDPVVRPPRPGVGSIVIYLGSTSVADFFHRYIAGLQSVRKLHYDLMAAPIDCQRELLIGWLRGDGGFHTDSRNRAKLCGTSSSETLARQMFTIAIRCGLRPSFKRRQRNFDVYFASEDAALLGWNPRAKKFRSGRRIINKHMLVRITDLTQIEYQGNVYDLDVNHDDLFVAGYLLTHNCDPPYSHEERHSGCYATEMACAAHVREWAIARGRDPEVRIALCGYNGEHDFPADWTCWHWKANGGYGSQGEGRARENAGRECVWFSPYCIKPNPRPSLFDLEDL